MRMSQLLVHTLRESPTEADTTGHALLLRAGFVKQLAAGIFSFTPLGLRVKHKLERILREAMQAMNVQEVSLPVVQPAELWRESGRWQEVGEEMARLKDRSDRELCLAMTHEEAATHMIRSMVRSYRQLPLAIYQLQTKFRDEPRARGGLIRVREFTMKDAYSFHASQEDLDGFYERMHETYQHIFSRCGLEVLSVESDQGMMGGSGAHEFMMLTSIGEDTLMLCHACGYRANRQVARFRKPVLPHEAPAPLEEVGTPHTTTILDLSRFLKLEPARTAKAVFLIADTGEEQEILVFAVLRGDMELNETKLSNITGARRLRPASEDEIHQVGAEPGYASPIGIRRHGVLLVVDDAVAATPNLVAGANKANYHLRNTNYGRDYQADILGDIAVASAGDACPHCGQPMVSERGVEVGNIFKLGTRYSQRMNATFLDERGKEQPFIMGSYGIGSGRLMACIAETHHDEQGLVWPAAVAPFEAVVVSLATPKTPEVAREAEDLYTNLQESGIEVLLDERDERPGVKFADADLLGIPVRITVGPQGVKEGKAEVKWRARGGKETVALQEVTAHVLQGIGR